VTVREAECSTGPLARRDCLHLFVPVQPPVRGELARITVRQPR
jgi:hypothetical protein